MFYVTVKISDIRAGFDGEFLFNIFRSNEFTPFLPFKRIKSGFRKLILRNLYEILHCAIQVRFRNVQCGFHDLVEAVIRHVASDEQLRRRNVIQLQ